MGKTTLFLLAIGYSLLSLAQTLKYPSIIAQMEEDLFRHEFAVRKIECYPIYFSAKRLVTAVENGICDTGAQNLNSIILDPRLKNKAFITIRLSPQSSYHPNEHLIEINAKSDPTSMLNALLAAPDLKAEQVAADGNWSLAWAWSASRHVQSDLKKNGLDIPYLTCNWSADSDSIQILLNCERALRQLQTLTTNPEIRDRVFRSIEIYPTLPSIPVGIPQVMLLSLKDTMTPQQMLEAIRRVPRVDSPEGRKILADLRKQRDLEASYEARGKEIATIIGARSVSCWDANKGDCSRGLDQLKLASDQIGKLPKRHVVGWFYLTFGENRVEWDDGNTVAVGLNMNLTAQQMVGTFDRLVNQSEIQDRKPFRGSR